MVQSDTCGLEHGLAHRINTPKVLGSSPRPATGGY